MLDTRTRLAAALFCLIFLSVSSAALWRGRAASPAAAPIRITAPEAASPPAASAFNTSATVPEPAASTQADKRTEILYVHVAGAVKNPSLYELAPGSRVMHAVRAAGGPTAKADLDAVNLAEKIEDGEKIYIPEKSAAHAESPYGNTIGRRTIHPRRESSAIAPLPVVPYAPPLPRGSSHGGSRGARSASGGKLTSPSEGKININTASDAELERLPGVGPAIAARIMAYRQENHGFQKPEDLLNVSGVGEKKYAKIAPFVTI